MDTKLGGSFSGKYNFYIFFCQLDVPRLEDMVGIASRVSSITSQSEGKENKQRPLASNKRPIKKDDLG